MHKEVWKRLKSGIPSPPKMTQPSVVIDPNPPQRKIRIKNITHAYEAWSRERAWETMVRQQARVYAWHEQLTEEERLNSQEFKHSLRKLGIK